MSAIGEVKKVWTEEELQRLPEDGYIHEVVDGEMIMSPKNNFYHGDICSRLLAALVTFNQARKLGVVLDSSTGFWMLNRNCRAPDVSFVSKGRMRELGFSRNSQRFFPGAPDLAVEIMAPSNTPAEMHARLKDFFSSGTQVAWIVHPEGEFVEICHSPTARQILGVGAVLDGEHLLPGFRFPIADLFHPEDWG